MVRIDLPDEICAQAEKHLDASGYVSVSDCARDQVRRWVSGLEVEVTKADILRTNTLNALLPQWASNFRENVSVAYKSPDMYAVENVEKIKNAKSAIIIGAGPSVKKYNHLKMLAESNYDGLVIVCDRILIPCLEAGVIPDIVCSIDGDKSIVDFYNSPLVNRYAHKIQAIFSTTVDPDVVNAWPCKDTLHFMNCHMDGMESPLTVSKFMFFAANKTVIQSGGQVGLTCWFIAQSLHKNPLCMIGIELSHPCPCEIEEIESYQMYHNMHGGDPEKVAKCFRLYHNPFFNNDCITHYVWDTYYEVARSWMSAMYKGYGIKTFSCTGSGLIDETIDGVESMYFDMFLRSYKELEKTEEEKLKKIKPEEPKT